MIRQATIPTMCAYASKGKELALAHPSNKQLAVFNCRAWNRSGSTINVGMVRRFADGLGGRYKLYTVTGGGTPVYTAVTAAALAAGVAVVTTVNNDGFIIGSYKKSGFLGFTVSNSATGGTYAFQYWNGSAFTTLTTIENPTDLGSTGDKLIVFLAPMDWVAGGPATTDQDMYQIFVKHTTAPGDTGSINALWVGEMLDYYEGVGDNNAIQLIFDSDRPMILEGSEGLHPYFSTANAANAFAAFYSTV